MLKGSEIRVGSDLNYENITKEIKNDFLPTEVRTDIAVRSFTEDDITVLSAAVIYNQNKLNLEILRQVYQMSAPANNDDSGGTGGHGGESEQRLKRAFKKKFRDLCGELSGNRILGLVQIGSVEALEKELELVLRKSDLLAEKLDDKEDVNYVVFEDE